MQDSFGMKALPADRRINRKMKQRNQNIYSENTSDRPETTP